MDVTTNYLFGLSFFCASIALARGTKLLAAGIYDAARDELFSAASGAGAVLNGKKITAAGTAALENSMPDYRAPR